MAETPDIEAQANADSNLQLVATVGPFPVSYTTGSTTSVQQRTWNIYQVADSAEVAPLVYQPVVMTGVSQGGQPWLTASESWYLDPSRSDVFEAASGPKNWARVPASTTTLPRTPLPPVHVSDIHEGTQTISFDVDQTGVPVLVKTSYFPNWQVSGAKEVYRVTPNLMVVVPTANHVTLTYGYTPIDWAGFCYRSSVSPGSSCCGASAPSCTRGPCTWRGAGVAGGPRGRRPLRCESAWLLSTPRP